MVALPWLGRVGVVWVALCGAWAWADGPAATGPATTRPASGPAMAPARSKPGLNARLSVTEHKATLGGRELAYKATAGFLPFRDEAGKEKANFFFVAYDKVRGEGEGVEQRPITFVFNGGPGAAAVWLHLGTAGPVRVDLLEDGSVPPPPGRVVPNEWSWLDVTDLVFIDPVGTGFSRAAPGEKPEQFYGLREDLASVGEFIRLYTTRYDRWASPKFLAGESYGTTRAAGLSQHLADRAGLAVNGIILVSTVLNFQTISFAEGNDLPYALYLPTYAAIAHHHGRLPADLQARPLAEVVREAEALAAGEYLTALTKGASLEPAARRRVIEAVSRLTGLGAAYVDRNNLRVAPWEFRKELLAEQRRILGRFDGRITGFDPDPADTRADFDPSFNPYLTAYTSAFNAYVRGELRFESDLSYEVLSGNVHPWNWGRDRGSGGYVDVAGDLRSAMIKNPHLRVMVASGYYDLATPHYAADYTVNRLDLGPELRKNVTQTYYTGGHMMYHNRADLKKLKEDVAGFIRAVVAERGR